MADKCDRCAVGIIGTKSILAGDWKAAEADFEKLIEDWNEKTKRFAIPHLASLVNSFTAHCAAARLRTNP